MWIKCILLMQLVHHGFLLINSYHMIPFLITNCSILYQKDQNRVSMSKEWSKVNGNFWISRLSLFTRFSIFFYHVGAHDAHLCWHLQLYWMFTLFVTVKTASKKIEILLKNCKKCGISFKTLIWVLANEWDIIQSNIIFYQI